MKKGRHRRFEEARALKRSNETLDDVTVFPPPSGDPCPECDAPPGKEHAAWCLREDSDDEPEEEDELWK